MSDSTMTLTHQTETLEFREWFGGSKVIDKNGQPLCEEEIIKQLKRIGYEV
jgi:hypothetical protein